MRTLHRLGLATLLTLSLITSCSTQQGYPFHRLLPLPNANSAQVYIYRPHIYRSDLQDIIVKIDGKTLGTLPTATYIVKNMKPGKHWIALYSADIVGLLGSPLLADNVYLGRGQRLFLSITFHYHTCGRHYQRVAPGVQKLIDQDYCMLFAPVEADIAVQELRRLHVASWHHRAFREAKQAHAEEMRHFKEVQTDPYQSSIVAKAAIPKMRYSSKPARKKPLRAVQVQKKEAIAAQPKQQVKQQDNTSKQAVKHQTPTSHHTTPRAQTMPHGTHTPSSASPVKSRVYIPSIYYEWEERQKAPN